MAMIKLDSVWVLYAQSDSQPLSSKTHLVKCQYLSDGWLTTSDILVGVIV